MERGLVGRSTRWIAALVAWSLILPVLGQPGIAFAAPGDGGLAVGEHWLEAFGRSSGGWNENHPRVVGDVNGDGLADIVGFASSGSYLSLSTGSGFTPPQHANDQFGTNYGWQPGVHPRWLADVNGDGRDDLVGFSNTGVTVALSQGTQFGPANQWLAAYALHSGGWGEQNPRILGDVNGDGLADVVGFGAGGTYLSFSTGAGFTPAQWVSGEFGTNHGWQTDVTPRWLADVNGDGLDDLVGFASGGVLVALSHGLGFEASSLWLPAFGLTTGGWGAQYPRVMGDVNGDGLADVVGFASSGTFISLSNGSGFEPAHVASDEFGANHGWQTHVHPRWSADFDGDGQDDVVGFSERTVVVARSQYAPASSEPTPGECAPQVDAPASVELLMASFGAAEGDPDFVPAFDFDGNGLIDAADLDWLRVDLTGEAASCPAPEPIDPGPFGMMDVDTTLLCSNAAIGTTNQLSIASLPGGAACTLATLPPSVWLWGGMGEAVGNTIDPERIKRAVDQARAAGRTLVHLEEIDNRLRNGIPIDRELLAGVVEDLKTALGGRFPKLGELLDALGEANDLVDHAEEIAQLVVEVIDFINRIEEAQNDPVKAAELFVDYLKLMSWMAETFGGPVGQVASAFLDQFSELLDNATATLEEIQRRTQENRRAGLDFIDEALGSGGTPNDEGETPFDEFLDDVGQGPPPPPTPDTRTELEKAVDRAETRRDMQRIDLREAQEAVGEQQEKVDELEERLDQDRQRREELGPRPDPVEDLDDADLVREIDELDRHIEYQEGALERARRELERLEEKRDAEREDLEEAERHYDRLRRILDDVELKREMRLHGEPEERVREAYGIRAMLIPPVEAFCDPTHEAWIAYDAYWAPPQEAIVSPSPPTSPLPMEPMEPMEPAEDPLASFGDPLALGLPTTSEPTPPTTVVVSEPAPSLSDPIVLSEPAPSLADPIVLSDPSSGAVTTDPGLAEPIPLEGAPGSGLISVEPAPDTSGFSQPWTLGLF